MAAEYSEKIGYDLSQYDEPDRARLRITAVTPETEQAFQLPITLERAQTFDDDHLVGFIHVQSDRLATDLDAIPESADGLTQLGARAKALGSIMLAAGMTERNPPKTPDDDTGQQAQERFTRTMRAAETEADNRGVSAYRALLDTYDDHPVIQVTDATFEKIKSDRAFANARQLQRAALIIVDAVARQ